MLVRVDMVVVVLVMVVVIVIVVDKVEVSVLPGVVAEHRAICCA